MKFFSLFKGKEIHLAPKKKIIPAKEYSKLVEATVLLEETKKEAALFREEVAKECELQKEEAIRKGFEEGLKQWNEQIAALENEKKAVRKEMEKTIVPLALTAVKKIIGRELELKPGTITDIISTALRPVSQHRRVTIYVHKMDLDIVEKERAEIRKLFEHIDSLSIAPRDDVEQGGCIIETEAGIINAQLDSQLRALEAAFSSVLKNQKKGS